MRGRETYEWGKQELARIEQLQRETAERIRPGASIKEAMAVLDVPSLLGYLEVSAVQGGNRFVGALLHPDFEGRSAGELARIEQLQRETAERIRPGASIKEAMAVLDADPAYQIHSYVSARSTVVPTNWREASR
jgi:hypothetical protein